MSTLRLYEDERHHLYTSDENRSLSVAIVEAVAEYEGVDSMECQFRLYDSINPSALDTLFHLDREAAATVSFAAGNSYVFLRDVGTGVEIWVSDFSDS